MIIFKSTHIKLQVKHFALQLEHEELREKWNALVTKINAKGGAQFLPSESKQFDKGEIKKADNALPSRQARGERIGGGNDVKTTHAVQINFGMNDKGLATQPAPQKPE
jgi:hypothetical protein